MSSPCNATKNFGSEMETSGLLLDVKQKHKCQVFTQKKIWTIPQLYFQICFVIFLHMKQD